MMFPDPETVERVIKGMDIAGIHPSLKLLCDAAAAGLALHQAISQPTDEMIEAGAKALAKQLYTHRTWDDLYKWEIDRLLDTVRTALAAVASVLLASPGDEA